MKTIEIKVNVDTAPIDSLIARLERAVELQKQLTPHHYLLSSLLIKAKHTHSVLAFILIALY